MLTTYIHYGLLVALAIALVFAAFTDIRSRTISNWLNLGIAAGAPVFWWASGMTLWPDLAIQVGVALLIAAFLIGLWAMNLMGGGDVKLLAALALWIDPFTFLQLLMIMAIAGGVLSIVMAGYHVMKRQKQQIAVPYGVAIAFGGLWVLYPKLIAVPSLA